MWKAHISVLVVLPALTFSVLRVATLRLALVRLVLVMVLKPLGLRFLQWV
jgi:hypothetical protein